MTATITYTERRTLPAARRIRPGVSIALVGLLQPGGVAAARQGDEHGVREQSGEPGHDEAGIADTRHREGGHTFVPLPGLAGGTKMHRRFSD
jgi:hypothetical protein